MMTNPIVRISLIVVATAIAGVGIWLRNPPQPAPVPGDALQSAPYRVCPVAEAGGGFSARVGLYLEGGGSSRLGAVGGRDTATTFAFTDSFAYQTDVGALAELGLTPVLIESPAVAGVYNKAGDAAAVAGCIDASAEPVAALGMATEGDERSSLILANPFAVEAAVQLEGVSEFGLDTPTDLEQVRIPAFTSLELDLNRSLAGRESLSFVITPITGNVVAGMRRGGATDIGASEAIAGSTQWYFALPDFGIDGTIHLRALADGDTAFRVDRIEPDGLVEGIAEGIIPTQSEGVFALSELEAGEGGFLIASDQPIAAALVYVADGIRAVSPGASQATNTWALPVSARPSEGRTAFWILNTTDRDLTATVESLAGTPVRTMALPAGSTQGTIALNFQGLGALVSADGPIAVFYGVLSGEAIGMSVATPLE
jgi:hypothetical protein